MDNAILEKRLQRMLDAPVVVLPAKGNIPVVIKTVVQESRPKISYEVYVDSGDPEAVEQLIAALGTLP